MHRLLSSLIVSTALSSTACQHAHSEPREEATFIVTSPLRTDTDLSHEYVAQLSAIQRIEVRALEPGYLVGTFVDEGQRITKGTKMFQIMPMLVQAEVRKATAEADLAGIELSNTKLLSDKNVVSTNELALAKARLAKAQAQVDLAAAHQSLTDIRAPFDGIMGRLHVRKGSLVSEGELMTTLSDNSTIWAYFNVSESQYLEYQARPDADRPTPVKLELANGAMFDQPGKIETIEADFNNETGNLAFRAAFPNPKGLLRHGETGKVVMTTHLPDALVIPQKSTFDVLDKKFVFVVDDQNVVHSRAITVSAEKPNVYVVATGLDEKDRIIVEGLRKVRDGAAVAVQFKEPADVLSHLEVPSE